MSEGTAIQKAPVGVGDRGLEIRSLNDLVRFADCVIQAGVAPKGMNQAAVVVAVQMGYELGLPPMASVQNIAVINGRPSIWGDAALAVCHASPWFADMEETIEGEGDKMAATCKVWKKGKQNPIVKTFSVADAKAAQLWGKQGPWTQYPKRMLQMRARGFALRDAFPGALRGMLFAEEARDVPKPVDNEYTEPTANSLDDITERLSTKQAEAPSPMSRDEIIAALATAMNGMTPRAQKEALGGKLPEDMTDEELSAVLAKFNGAA